MFLFDPRAGTGAFIRTLLLSELTFNTADMAAEAGDDSMADALWQMGAQLAHPVS